MTVMMQQKVTGDGGEVRRRRHGQHRRGDVLGLDPVGHQLVQVRRVHVLVVVPPEAVEGDEQQLVPAGPQRVGAGAAQRRQHEEQLRLHLHTEGRTQSEERAHLPPVNV